MLSFELAVAVGGLVFNCPSQPSPVVQKSCMRRATSLGLQGKDGSLLTSCLTMHTSVSMLQAATGQVWVTSMAWDVACAALHGWVLATPRGAHALKGIVEKVELLSLRTVPPVHAAVEGLDAELAEAAAAVAATLMQQMMAAAPPTADALPICGAGSPVGKRLGRQSGQSGSSGLDIRGSVDMLQPASFGWDPSTILRGHECSKLRGCSVTLQDGRLRSRLNATPTDGQSAPLPWLGSFTAGAGSAVRMQRLPAHQLQQAVLSAAASAVLAHRSLAGRWALASPSAACAAPSSPAAPGCPAAAAARVHAPFAAHGERGREGERGGEGGAPAPAPAQAREAAAVAALAGL